jgi:hypothetical protein
MFDSLTPWVDGLANNPELGFVILFCAGAAIFGLERFLRLQARRRLIQDTPTSRIRSAAQGYVELEGYAENSPESPIFSPITHTACTWYRYKVEERHTDSKGNTQWQTVRSGTSTHLFLISDNTGECVIDPDNAVVEAAHKNVWQVGDYRYTEELIFPDQALYALGWLKSYEPLQTTLHDWTRDIVIAWKSDPATRHRFDLDGDGELNAQEFEALREAASQAAFVEQQAELRERSNAGQTHMLNAGDPQGRPLLLSTHPQHKLAERLRLHAWFWLAGALAALGLCTYLITEKLPATML